MTEEKMSSRQVKEKMRLTQLGLLNSQAIRDLYIASIGRDTQKYGQISDITQINYVKGLENADEYVGQLLAHPLLQKAKYSIEKGENIYEGSQSSNAFELLNNTKKIFQGALTKIKVSDVLQMLQIGGIHEGNLSKEQQNMYMEDLAKANKELYGAFTGSYLDTIETRGIAQSMLEQNTQKIKGLEKILQTNPKELKKAKEYPQAT